MWRIVVSLVCTRVGIVGMVASLVCTRVVYWWVYTSLGMSLPTPPWVYLHPTMHHAGSQDARTAVPCS